MEIETLNKAKELQVRIEKLSSDLRKTNELKTSDTKVTIHDTHRTFVIQLEETTSQVTLDLIRESLKSSLVLAKHEFKNL